MTTELNEREMEKMIQDAAGAFEPPAGLQDQIKTRLLGDASMNTYNQTPRDSRSVPGSDRRRGRSVRFLKPVLVAAVVLAAVIGSTIYWKSGTASVAFADVVRALVDTRTATFKMTTTGKIAGKEMPTQQFDGIFMDPGRMRMDSTQGTVILDTHEGKMTTILPSLKRVSVVVPKNMPKEAEEAWNPFEMARSRLQKMQSEAGQAATELGHKKISGCNTVGYSIKPSDSVTIEVWADVETKLPIVLAVTTHGITNTMSDIVLGANVDEKLFSPEIPKGYTVQEIVNDMSPPTEADLIEMFKIWTSHMDGVFPATLKQSAVETFVEQQRKNAEVAGQKPGADEVFALQGLIMKMSRGGMFSASLPADSDKHYAGKGVKLNTPNTPVFWYRPGKSQAYRVIYADLSVKDVQADQLPAEKAKP